MEDAIAIGVWVASDKFRSKCDSLSTARWSPKIVRERDAVHNSFNIRRPSFSASA